MNEGAGQHDEDDDGECDSQRCLDVEELAVEDEACQPEGEVQPVYAFFAVVLLQDEVIRKKDGCHRSKDGSDEVQEFLETARVHHDSKADAACAGDKGERFSESPEISVFPETPAENASRNVVVTVERRTIRIPTRPIPA